ncbi:MAG: type IV secretion system DNA-binding domain-containing protein [Acidobacteriota bacterium]
MLPLDRPRNFSLDPLTAVIGALAETVSGEVAILQVLFQGVRAPWAESVVRSVVTPSGDPFFADAPEVTKLAREKMSAPLFAVAVRLVARAEREERLWTLLSGALGALSGATRGDNEFVPFGIGGSDEVLGDVILRTTHRSGMLLSLPELVSLVHLPSPSIEGVNRDTTRTKALPAEALSRGIFLGYNVHAGVEREARLSTDARMRHTHVVGASGTGKSTLLVSMILQDIAAGHGVGVIDPHGDLIDEVLGAIPENRAEDVIVFDPAEPDFVVGWNMLSSHSEAEKDMLASDLVAVFRRLATSWGDQMTAVLANAILAFLESERGGTLLDLRRFLVDASFRREFLTTVRDEYARNFWTTEFPMLSGKPQASILTRLDTILRGRLLRGVVTAVEKPLDFRSVVDDRRILLAKLSQGAIGEENAALLGSLLVSKLHQVCLLRQDQPESAREPFYLYLDEFHNLATPSMAALFSGARKYRLGLTVAHQDLYQLHSTVPEVERAVLGNAYTRICFRLGDEDARTLAQGFSFFEADDLGNLGTGEAVCRVGRKEQDFNLRTVYAKREDPEARDARRREIRVRSLSRWGARRSEEATARPSPSPEEPRKGDAPAPRAETPPVTPAREAGTPPLQHSKADGLQKEPPFEPRRPGKGGPEHTYLQELIKRWAQEQGFRAVVEEQIAGGRESIDVALYRGDARIACEISITTPLEYEVGNVRKCLAAGFQKVAMVSLKKGRLSKLREALAEALSAEDLGRVHIFTPEELLAWLSGQPAEEQEDVVAGYKVKVRYQHPGDGRSNRVAEILARSMSRLQKEE